MKYTPLLRFAFVGLLLASMSGCLRDECTSSRTYVRFDPVYKLPSDFRVGVSAESPRSLQNPGKIYAYGNYLLINELKEGIHVIDNSDPSNPQNIAFWKIPGNVDMAVYGDYLYADQYVDLLTIDISDMQNPDVVCSAQDAFALHGFVPQLGYLVDYTQTEVTEDIPCTDSRWNSTWFMEGDVLFSSDMSLSGASSFSGGIRRNNGVPASTGIAGSYARFGITDGFLYTVDNFTLRSYSLQDPSCPNFRNAIPAGWNIETIFPWKDRLFLGSQSGVFIFNNTNPALPVQEAVFVHATGCDPVVCDENNAYVTIHDGTDCNGTFNLLEVIDIRNLPSASLTKSYNMTRPMGLSVTDEHLFLCDDGLKIYDKSDPSDLKLLSHLNNLKTYDIIAFSDDLLMIVGEGGFYQFDASDPANPKQISLIPVLQ
ncbi:MAG: hypothetical protein IT262_02010 [Saprospiraceae bacterium]|nr:hypothetical protein [Saprospiraceae bacterium]